MTETRRDLFKTSVASAFGLMSAAALTGCKDDIGKQGQGRKGRVALDATDTVILGWNESKDNTAPLPSVPTWYVFHKAAAGWEVYAYDGKLSDPNTSSTGAFDTYNWYIANRLSLMPIKDKFRFTNSANSVVFKFQGAYLDSASSDYLGQLGQAQHYFSQSTWNEIGKS
jgi:hypothetical protein